MKSINYFILNEDYLNFKKGTLILKGSERTEEGFEYYDVSTEIETGECYSTYDLPETLLSPADNEKIKIAEEFFKTH